MINRKQLRRTLTASGLAMLLTVAPICTYADALEDLDTSADIESVLEASEDAVEEALKASYEGYVEVTLADAFRAAAEAQAGTDLSWLQDARIFLQEAPNDKDGADLELTFDLNGTELYHTLFSYDGEEQVLYALCPELRDQTIAIPLNEVFQSAADQISGQVSPELIQDIMDLVGKLQEFAESIPPETLASELTTYLIPVVSRISSEEGTATIQADELEAKVATQTYSISAENMQELIPELLTLLSKDELLESALKSDFTNSALELIQKQTGSDQGMTGDDLYSVLESVLTGAADGDFSEMFGGKLTIGSAAEDEENSAFSLALALEQSGMTVDLFSLTGIAQQPDFAVEFTLGPVLASAMGLDESEKAGLVIRGSMSDEMLLNATVAVNLGGTSAELFRIEDLDLAQIMEGRVSGTFVVFLGGEKLAERYSVGEDGGQVIEILLDDELYLTIAMNLTQVDSTQLDDIDTNTSFVFTTMSELEEYLRNADVVGMLSKLKEAGVPEELVDLITSDETGTESSKENVEEAEDTAA